MSAKQAKSGKYQPQAQSSRMTYILGAIAVVVVAAVVIGGVLWQNSESKPVNDGYGTVRSATVELADGGVMMLGTPEAKVTIDVYEDFLCPACAQFEKFYGQAIAQAIDNGNLAVKYHFMNFLDAASASGSYSTRASAASQCVAATGDGTAFAKLHTTLFESGTQPAEKGKSDLSNVQLADVAKQSGASDEAVQCISSGSKVEGAVGTTAAAISEVQAATGRVSSPTVLRDGASVSTSDGNWVANLLK